MEELITWDECLGSVEEWRGWEGSGGILIVGVEGSGEGEWRRMCGVRFFSENGVAVKAVIGNKY